MSTWMFYAALMALMLSAAAWTLERATRGRRLPSRWIWAAALAGSCLLPLVALVPGAPQAAAIAVLVGSGGPALLAEGRADGVAEGAAPATMSAQGPTGALGAALRQRLAAPPSLPAAFDPFAAAAWLTISLLVAAALLRSLAALARARRGWKRQRVDGREVLVSEQVGPAVVGVFDPAIVMPRWALSMPAEDRSLMLRHEEEHRRAGDGALLLSAVLLLVLLPWNLPLWWQLRRLRLAIEVDCDRRVLLRGRAELRRYATLLIEMARRGGGSRLPALALTPPVTLLERRIRALTRRPGRRYGRAAALILAGGVLTAVACQVSQVTGPALAEARAESEARAEARLLDSRPVRGALVIRDAANDRTLIPRSALVLRGERRREVVFVLGDADEQGRGTADWRYVTTGWGNDVLVEIIPGEDTSPLEPGTIVLVDGHQYMANGIPVHLVEGLLSAAAGQDR